MGQARAFKEANVIAWQMHRLTAVPLLSFRRLLSPLQRLCDSGHADDALSLGPDASEWYTRRKPFSNPPRCSPCVSGHRKRPYQVCCAGPTRTQGICHARLLTSFPRDAGGSILCVRCGVPPGVCVTQNCSPPPFIADISVDDWTDERSTGNAGSGRDAFGVRRRRRRRLVVASERCSLGGVRPACHQDSAIRTLTKMLLSVALLLG